MQPQVEVEPITTSIGTRVLFQGLIKLEKTGDLPVCVVIFENMCDTKCFVVATHVYYNSYHKIDSCSKSTGISSQYIYISPEKLFSKVDKNEVRIRVMLKKNELSKRFLTDSSSSHSRAPPPIDTTTSEELFATGTCCESADDSISNKLFDDHIEHLAVQYILNRLEVAAYDPTAALFHIVLLPKTDIEIVSIDGRQSQRLMLDVQIERPRGLRTEIEWPQRSSLSNMAIFEQFIVDGEPRNDSGRLEGDGDPYSRMLSTERRQKSTRRRLDPAQPVKCAADSFNSYPSNSRSTQSESVANIVKAAVVVFRMSGLRAEEERESIVHTRRAWLGAIRRVIRRNNVKKAILRIKLLNTGSPSGGGMTEGGSSSLVLPTEEFVSDLIGGGGGYNSGGSGKYSGTGSSRNIGLGSGNGAGSSLTLSGLIMSSSSTRSLALSSLSRKPSERSSFLTIGDDDNDSIAVNGKMRKKPVVRSTMKSSFVICCTDGTSSLHKAVSDAAANALAAAASFASSADATAGAAASTAASGNDNNEGDKQVVIRSILVNEPLEEEEESAAFTIAEYDFASDAIDCARRGETQIPNSRAPSRAPSRAVSRAGSRAGSRANSRPSSGVLSNTRGRSFVGDQNQSRVEIGGCSSDRPSSSYRQKESTARQNDNSTPLSRPSSSRWGFGGSFGSGGSPYSTARTPCPRSAVGTSNLLACNHDYSNNSCSGPARGLASLPVVAPVAAEEDLKTGSGLGSSGAVAGSNPSALLPLSSTDPNTDDKHLVVTTEKTVIMSSTSSASTSTPGRIAPSFTRLSFTSSSSSSVKSPLESGTDCESTSVSSAAHTGMKVAASAAIAALNCVEAESMSVLHSGLHAFHSLVTHDDHRRRPSVKAGGTDTSPTSTTTTTIVCSLNPSAQQEIAHGLIPSSKAIGNQQLPHSPHSNDIASGGSCSRRTSFAHAIASELARFEHMVSNLRTSFQVSESETTRR